MAVFAHELKRNRLTVAIWTAAIAFMIFICVLMFPEMSGQMETVGDVFANMGGFTAAFGMDKVNFGEFSGFYAIECGNILGIGGAFFAALLGISMLSKEEKERTAEFLLTHPVRRASVTAQKLAALLVLITALNLITALVSMLSFAIIGEQMAVYDFVILHGAYFIMQLEISCICFGISAFVRRGQAGIGIGLAAVLYFLSIISNISESAEFLRYITPFAYADAADIVANSSIDLTLVLLGTAYAVIALAAGFAKYMKKDIAS